MAGRGSRNSVIGTAMSGLNAIRDGDWLTRRQVFE